MCGASMAGFRVSDPPSVSLTARSRRSRFDSKDVWPAPARAPSDPKGEAATDAGVVVSREDFCVSAVILAQGCVLLP